MIWANQSNLIMKELSLLIKFCHIYPFCSLSYWNTLTNCILIIFFLKDITSLNLNCSWVFTALQHMHHVNIVAACSTLYTYVQYVWRRLIWRFTFLVHAKQYNNTRIINANFFYNVTYFQKLHKTTNT